jgi:hypothetical protein
MLTAWLKLENIKLNGRRHKRAYVIGFHLYKVSRMIKPTGKKCHFEVIRDWTEERMGRNC